MQTLARTFTSLLIAASLLPAAAQAAPGNDDFANADELSGFPVSTESSNVDATKEPGEPDHAGDPGGHSVWWNWSAPAGEAIELGTCNSNFDTTLAVYTGASVSALTEVASNDDACGTGSRVVFTASAGQTYRIAVDGYGGEAGDIKLELGSQPPLAPLYIALGDSVSRGYGAPAAQGFVDLYHGYLRVAGDSGLELSNLAVPGETSSSMRSNGQLDTALTAIGEPSDIRAVTLDIGGNDGVSGQCPTGYNTSPCPFRDNYTAIVQALRSALDTDPGDETLKVMQYYNPAAGTGSAEEAIYEFALLGSDGTVDCSGSGSALGLNDLIACVGRAHGAVPIDTHPTFKAGGRSLMADAVHPNATGHAYIACLFEHPDRAGSPNPCEPTIGLPPPPPPSLEVTLSGRTRQRVLRQRGVVVFVTSNEDAVVRASATVLLPRAGATPAPATRLRLVRFRPVTTRVAAGARTKLKLRLAAKKLRLVRRALRSRRSLTARVRVRATDSAGSSRAAARRIKLVR